MFGGSAGLRADRYDPHTHDGVEFGLPDDVGYTHTGYDPDGKLFFFETETADGHEIRYLDRPRHDGRDEWETLGDDPYISVDPDAVPDFEEDVTLALGFRLRTSAGSGGNVFSFGQDGDGLYFINEGGYEVTPCEWSTVVKPLSIDSQELYNFRIDVPTERHPTVELDDVFLLSKEPPERFVWEWDVAGNFEGWTVSQDDIDATVSGGALRMDITGPDPHIMSPSITFDASPADYVEVRVRNGTGHTGGKLFWHTGDGFSGSLSQGFDISANDEEFQTYRIDVGGNPDWSGTIRQIRLDIPSSASGSGTVEFDRIELGRET